MPPPVQDRVVWALLALLEPVTALWTPGKRTYWVFVAVALAMALGVWVFRARRVPLSRFLFSRQHWLHPSAVADYGFVFLRFLASALVFAPLAVSTAVVATHARDLVGAAGASALTVDPVVGVLGFSIVGFVLDDLSRYGVHRLLHRVPALWQIHQVHHSAEVLTPLTVYRVHPVEVFIHQARGRLCLGLVGGVFAVLSPGATWVEILGVDALSFAWNTLGANLRHSQVWLSYGRRLEHVLISPAQHQIHHSLATEHRDRNFGSALAIWDWAFGTLVLAPRRLRLRYGVDAAQRNHGHDPIDMLWRPVVAAALVSLPRPLPASLSRPRVSPRSTPSSTG